MSNQPNNERDQNFDDVLSSIRKLVSEEASSTLEERLAKEENKLVLTPELRVVDNGPTPLRLDTPVNTKADVAPFHDEVALRALVSEMIREELQGELGARITRNVRKLIKREIEAALAAARV